MNKFAKTFAKGLLVFVAALLSLSIVIVATLWFFPGVALNTANLQRAKPFLEKHVTWTSESTQMKVRSLSFFEKSVGLAFKNACFVYVSEAQTFCFKDLALKASVDLSGFKLKTINVAELKVYSEELAYEVKAKAQSEAPKDSTPTDYSILKRIQLGRIFINIPKLTLKTKDDTFTALTRLENADTFELVFQASSQSKKTFELMTAIAKAPAVRHLSDLLRLRSASVHTKLPQSRNIELSILGDNQDQAFNSEKVSFQGNLDFLDPKNKAKLKFQVARNVQQINVDISGALQAKDVLRSPLNIETCKIDLTLPPESSNAFVKDAKLLCQVNLKTRQFLRDKRYLTFLPEKFDAVLKAHAATEGNEENLKGWASLELGPVMSSLIKGGLEARYEFDLARNFDESDVKVKANFEITSFKQFARVSNDVGFLIPSPINVLDGNVNLSLDGAFALKPIEGKAKLKLVTDLASPDQALDMQLDADMTFVPCLAPSDFAILQADIVTTKMKIKLPNIDYKSPPAIVPDARFVTAKDLAKEKSKARKVKTSCGLNYLVKFKNEKSSPILISAPVVKNDIPLQIQMQIEKDKPLQGSVRVENFSTELFRRAATVQNFDYDLASKIVQGRFRVDYSDYKIYVNLSGQTKSVRVDFESDPPLERQQVLAILLFGRPLEGLDDDQSGSVSNASAAAKDGALSLASLYLFASTPIESVGYNPHTNGLTAKIKLANGTTLNVGANELGMTDIGVTKRLSKHWRIQSSVKDPTEAEERSASAILEWFNRF